MEKQRAIARALSRLFQDRQLPVAADLRRKKMQSEEKMKQREWDSGAKRDSNDGKNRPDLIPAECLWRLAWLYKTGADHYGVNNWCKGKGIPTESYIESAERHWMKYRMGWTDEDHLASLVFNVFGIMWNEIHATDKNTYKWVDDEIDPAWKFDCKETKTNG